MLPVSQIVSPLLAAAPATHPIADLSFAAPWEARAFAMVVALSQAGHFSWSEWVACFCTELAEAEAERQAGGASRVYYECWLEAVEHLVAARGMVDAGSLQASHGHPHPNHD